jgi:cell division protein FtsB
MQRTHPSEAWSSTGLPRVPTQVPVATPRLSTTHAVVIAVVLAGAVLCLALFSPRGVARLRALQAEEQALTVEVEALRKDNQHRADKAALLRDDVTATQAPARTLVLDKLARDELGYSGKSEVVFQIPVQIPAQVPAKASP